MKEAAAMAEQDKGEPILSELYNSHFPTLPLFTHFAWSVRAGPLTKTQLQKADCKGLYEHIKEYPAGAYAAKLSIHRQLNNRDSGSCPIVATTRSNSHFFSGGIGCSRCSQSR